MGWIYTRINPEFIFLGLCYNPYTRGNASRKVWGQICPWFGYSEYCCFHITHAFSSKVWRFRLAYCSTYLGRSWWGECLLCFLFSHIETYSLIWNWEMNSWINAKYIKSYIPYKKTFCVITFNHINTDNLRHFKSWFFNIKFYTKSYWIRLSMAYPSFHMTISLSCSCFLICVLRYRNSTLLNHLLDAMKHPPFNGSKLHPTVS